MGASRVLLVAACAALAGCAASPPPPPSLSLRNGGDLQASVRWQQFCEQATSVSQASWLASSRGNDGWELVSMYAGVLCYKRPVPPAEPPPAAAPAPVMVGARTPSWPASSTTGARSTVPVVLDPGF